MTFIDTASCYAVVRFLTTRTHVPQALTHVVTHLNNTQKHYPQFITTDGAKEYTSTKVQTFMAERGIKLQTTTPYTPEENSIAERLNRTLMDKARASLHHSQLDGSYWEDAVKDPTFK